MEVGDAELHNAHTYFSTSEGWVWIENIDRVKDDRSPYMNGKYILVKKEPIIDGTHVVSATTHPDSRPGSYVVSFALSNSGTLKFEEATARLAEKGYISIILDGKLMSRPWVKSKIGGQGQIDGFTTEKAADDIATVLRSGSLPVPVELISERVISAALDLSTPEKAWAAIVDAFKSGDKKRIEAVTTEKGREVLKKWEGTEALAKSVVESWNIEGKTARGTAIENPGKRGAYTEIKLQITPEGWKLDELIPGK